VETILGTHYTGSERERRALNAFIALARACNSVEARLAPVIGAFALTGTQFGVVETLYHLGPMCQSALGAKNLKSSGNITLVVDNLERAGIVRRERSAEDRRFVIVHLTPPGRDLVERALPAVVDEIVSAMGVLTDREQEDLRVLCRTLGTGERARAG
jgi:MarR family 2-MHQ and catechol resistance regulon transcriptional repressor